MNRKNLTRRPSTVFGVSSQVGHSLQGTPFSSIFSALPQRLSKNKVPPGSSNLRGKPACRISFFLESTFIACGREDPTSQLKQAGGRRESSCHS